jgi:hypothetical protein
MSISFRNDFGHNDNRVVNGVHTVVAPNQQFEARAVETGLDARPLAASELGPAEGRGFDGRGADVHPPDGRPQDVRSPDVRSIDARLTDIKNGASTRDLPDVKMDQIRELLFGEVQRQNDLRVASLEAKYRELETSLQHRLDAMQARLDALAAETRGDRRQTLEELGRGLADLSDRIKRIPRE